MKVIYVDTSALIAVHFKETTHLKKTLHVLNHAEEVISSVLIEAEFLATLQQENRPIHDGIQLLSQISLLLPERSLQPELERVLAHGYQKGGDVFHLACALYVDPKAEQLIFLTLDERQRKIARKLGFDTIFSE